MLRPNLRVDMSPVCRAIRAACLPAAFLATGFGLGWLVFERDGVRDSASHGPTAAAGSLAVLSDNTNEGSDYQPDFVRILGTDATALLEASSLPEAHLADFGRRLVDGRVSRDELSFFLGALALRWPDEVMPFLDSLDPKVVHALELEGLALRKLAESHPDTAVALLSGSRMWHLPGRHLYDIGVELYRRDALPEQVLERINPEDREILKQGETEAVLRRSGTAGMIDWIGSLAGSSVDEFDADGRLVATRSGTTSFALDRMSHFLRETSDVDKDRLFARIAAAPFLSDSLNASTAFRALARVDVERALKYADGIPGDAGLSAISAAFRVAAESDPELALKFISRTSDIARQNMFLQGLVLESKDEQVLREAREILLERGIDGPKVSR